MASLQPERLRDCAIVATINLFGASYFLLFLVHFLIFHFPSSPEVILKSLSVIFFCGGVIFWCLTSLIYRTIEAFGHGNAPNWQRLEFSGALILISATAIPYVILQFSNQPPVQIGSMCALALAAVGYLVDFLVVDCRALVAQERFPYHCASLGLLSLVPAIYALAEPASVPSPLAFQFCRMVICNSLGALHYLLRPLERMGLVPGWRPSLYTMHLALVHSMVVYSNDILHGVLGS
ncbi:hypothetical protein F1880_010322 [Penicillium rolfsii]|nr:hypothetical protein F1880_010322 [Penicillium rolfsii]